MNELIAPPSGYICHRLDSLNEFVVLGSRSMDRFYVTREPWSARCRAVGPLSASNVLRAYRIAQATVPDGCELGPWKSGFEWLNPVPLAGDDVNHWVSVELSWLPPSASIYRFSDFEAPINESCCSPLVPRPRISWSDGRESEEAFFRDLVGSRAMVSKGRLASEWNIHPRGSLVAASSRKLEEFTILDIATEANT